MVLRRQLSIKVQKSERKFKDVFNKSPLPIIQLVGEDMVIELVNSAAEDLYNVKREDLIGKNIQAFNIGTDSGRKYLLMEEDSFSKGKMGQKL